MSKSARLHRPVAPLPYKCHLFPASDLHNAKLLSRNGPISVGERPGPFLTHQAVNCSFLPATTVIKLGGGKEGASEAD